MTKSNGIKSLKQAAKLLNRHAPDGESLAYINPDEGRLLKAHGGSGIETLSGVPTYGPAWDWFTEKVYEPARNYIVDRYIDGDNVSENIAKDLGTAYLTYKTYKGQKDLNEHEQAEYDRALAAIAEGEAKFAADIGQAPLQITNMPDKNALASYTDVTLPAMKTTAAAQGGRIGYDNGGIGQLMPRLGYQEGTHPLDGVAMQMFGKPFNSLNPLEQITVSQSQDQTNIKPAIQIPSDSTINTGDPYSSNIWTAAQGGRIGYGIGSLPINSQPQGEESIKMAGTDTPPIEMENLQDLLSAFYEAFGRYPTSIDELKGWARNKTQAPQEEVIRGMAAYGGRIGYAGGNQVLPLLDLGGQEKDYREDGGFVPIGRKEKADDVPARLSKNEFVFTADAVRAAGGGDIDEGAQRMYNVMKNLEAGGEISQETQGKI